MSTVRVRTAVRADLDAIVDRSLALDALGHEVEPRHEVPADRQAWRNTVEWMLFADHLLVPGGWLGTIDGAVVGVLVGEVVRGEAALGHPPRARIQMLWVDEAARRRGVGRALVDAFLTRCEVRGVRGCDVTTLVADARAVAFWRSLGFADLYVRLRR